MDWGGKDIRLVNIFFLPRHISVLGINPTDERPFLGICETGT
jgi:hypothetical protein|tara:strand:+ start:1008 stop:1133 length:126 start_codon:yes stop_codon:yes gene_type:complete